MQQLTVLEDRLQQWSVPNDVREAVRSAVGVVVGEGAWLVDDANDELVTLAVRGQPAAIYLSPSRVSAALAPTDADRAHRADSAIGLDMESETTWVVHCRYGRLDPSRLSSVTALMIKALRRYAPTPEPRQVVKQSRRRAPSNAGSTVGDRRVTSTRAGSSPAREEDRRRAADAAIPRCPVPGCNLPMVGGSCGFHD